jgi:hypothetical protein
MKNGIDNSELTTEDEVMNSKIDYNKQQSIFKHSHSASRSHLMDDDSNRYKVNNSQQSSIKLSYSVSRSLQIDTGSIHNKISNNQNHGSGVNNKYMRSKLLQ